MIAIYIVEFGKNDNQIFFDHKWSEFFSIAKAAAGKVQIQPYWLLLLLLDW